MILLWLLSLALRNSSIVDIFWGTGFVIVAWAAFLFTPDGFLPRKLLLAALVTIWGLRLSIHILRRNWGKPEDFRYAAWRQESGRSWWWYSFFKVFLLQGVLLWIISTPLVAAQFSPAAGAPGPARRPGRPRLGLRLLLRGRRRRAARALQERPGQQGQAADHRRLALHASPELLRRRRPVVGLLPDRRRRRRLVDGLQPDPDDAAAGARLGRRPAGEDTHRDQARLPRVRADDQRLRALVPAPPGRRP